MSEFKHLTIHDQEQPRSIVEQTLHTKPRIGIATNGMELLEIAHQLKRIADNLELCHEPDKQYTKTTKISRHTPKTNTRIPKKILSRT